jgi:DNA-binding response OmpR family regulator
MRRILLVGEDGELAEDLKGKLADLGFRMSSVSLGQRALEAVWHDRPDLILVHYSTNPGKVRSFCKELKKDDEARGVPIVALVPEEKSGQFDLLGVAEDFVLLPCRPDELELRLKQIEWKKHLALPDEGIRIGDLVIDFVGYEVLFQGIPVALTYREYELLKFLVIHPNRVFSRNVLLQKVWGYRAYVGTRTVDIHIRRLRSKLGEVGSRIHTVRNVGYKFVLESDK